MQSKNIQIHLPLLKEKEVELFVKREDLLHPFISGNKFRKLKYNLQKAKELGKTSLLTFGGAYSNHILATAAAGKEYGFGTLGVIRGEELGEDVSKTLSKNATLQKAANFGMEFLFVSRAAYQQKHQEAYIKGLLEMYPNSYVLPEGGTNALAIKGCEEILTSSDDCFTHIACAMGTGGTVTGIINASKKYQNVGVYPALKGNWIQEEMLKLQPNKNNWTLFKEYHFGGYGKVTQELVTFINTFKQQTQISLDPIYTGKMMYGLLKEIEQNQLKKGSKVLAIHTGGLQGIAGINTRLAQKNKPLII
ncbi:1-aminocyclopropane-1-carboxylate deaminase/D-cysteine desulfhydrase [Ochrovirga pacifica]|uniref:1-aminocyclopropane-1-carboxylate deaminase/D-cysteine desulfhydrase n=1 Tax=Ochrovirga pacifica TaxID=1042376 RepID=UPI000255A7DC|nr:pyridoxal-phosphate dependent enzyme [Ochrovirga pacifica]